MNKALYHSLVDDVELASQYPKSSRKVREGFQSIAKCLRMLADDEIITDGHQPGKTNGDIRGDLEEKGVTDVLPREVSVDGANPPSTPARKCHHPHECIEDCLECGTAPGEACDHCETLGGCPLLQEVVD